MLRTLSLHEYTTMVLDKNTPRMYRIKTGKYRRCFRIYGYAMWLYGKAWKMCVEDKANE